MMCENCGYVFKFMEDYFISEIKENEGLNFCCLDCLKSFEFDKQTEREEVLKDD